MLGLRGYVEDESDRSVELPGDDHVEIVRELDDGRSGFSSPVAKMRPCRRSRPANFVAARNWYHSAEYQEHAPLRHAAADNKAAIVAGFELPAG
jgi:hypothetical protein